MAAGRSEYQYNVKSLLGTGAFADVFRGHACSGPRAGQTVAVKRIDKRRLQANPRLQCMFLTEIDVLRQLGAHPHICQMLDHFESRAGTYVFLVLQYCDSGDLHHHLAQANGPLPPAHVEDITRQLAAGVRHMHLRNIVHRDLKPHNVLLHADDSWPCRHVVRITDFGLAKRWMPEGLAHTFCGSPLHMAPEVLMGGQYDPKVDLFSLGTIVYRMAIGHEPFAAQSIDELRSRHMRARMSVAGVPIPPGTDRDLTSILRGMLELDPERRINFDQFFRHPYLTRPLLVSPALEASFGDAQPTAARSATRSAPAAASVRLSGATLVRASAGASVNTSPNASVNTSTSANANASITRLGLAPAAMSVITASAADDFQVVDRYHVELCELLARASAVPNNTQQTGADRRRQTALAQHLERINARVLLICEVMTRFAASPTPRGRAERFMLLGHAVGIMRDVVNELRSELCHIRGRPSLTVLGRMGRFCATFGYCIGEINTLRPRFLADPPSVGMDVALAPDDLLLSAAHCFLARATELQTSVAAPTAAQWRVRDAHLMAALELVTLLRETAAAQLDRPDRLDRLDRLADSITLRLRTACGSQPIPVPSQHTTRAVIAQFCGSCGTQYSDPAATMCHLCGCARGLVTSLISGASATSAPTSASATSATSATTSVSATFAATSASAAAGAPAAPVTAAAFATASASVAAIFDPLLQFSPLVHSVDAPGAGSMVHAQEPRTEPTSWAGREPEPAGLAELAFLCSSK